MPRRVIRSDTQIAGRVLTLGGLDPETGFGDVGAAALTLKKSGLVSPLLTIEAALPTDTVMQLDGSVIVNGNLTVNGTSETVTNSLTVNGDTILGNNVDVDTVDISGGLTVVCGTVSNLDAVIQGNFKVKNQAGSTDQFTVDGVTGDALINGDLQVNGVITGGGQYYSGLKQYATYATEPGLSSGPGDPGWSTAVDGAIGAILRLDAADDFGSASGLGDGIDPTTLFLGFQVSVNNFAPIQVYKEGLLLRAGSGQEYTVAAISGLIEVTFVNPIFTDARVAIGFGKKI